MRTKGDGSRPAEPTDLMSVIYYVFPVKGDCKADVVFLLESSDSYSTLKWFAQKQFVIDVVQSLKVLVAN